MANNNNGRFQFRLGPLLFVVTAFCLLFGFLEWILPDDTPTESRLIMYITFTVMGLWLASAIVRERRRWPRPSPTDYVVVKVDTKWLRRVKSPFIFGPVATLTGVSLTFAPFYLFWCGQWQQLGILEWIIVALCFLMIYFIPSFYMNLAGEVLTELAKIDRPPSDTTRI